MGTIECSQPASKSSWDSQDFGDISMVLKMAYFRKSTGPRWVKEQINRAGACMICQLLYITLDFIYYCLITCLCIILCHECRQSDIYAIYVTPYTNIFIAFVHVADHFEHV